jgi:uncharacterized protein
VHNPFLYLKLKQNILKGISWGIAISLVLIILQVSLSYAFDGTLIFHLGLRWFTTPILTFPEEVLFRGLILQKISESTKFSKANLYTSFLFVSIHFPAWFLSGITIPKFIFSVCTVFIVSYVLGFVYKKTDSLWSSTILHTIYNVLLYARMVK